MKSYASDYLELARRIYLDACLHCVAKVSHRDLRTIRSRVQTQGLSFLTITLPDFCSDFEKSLELGQVDPSLFRSFKKSGSIPAFLQGMIGQVFVKETGRINYDNPQIPRVISAVRQICLAFKKTKGACVPSRERRAIEGFIACEQELSSYQLPEEDRKNFSYASFVLWNRILADIRLDLLVPRHGPGNTAERYTPNGKYRWRIWHHRLEPYFPLIGNGFPLSIGESFVETEELKQVTYVSSDMEQPSRVVLVPKTKKAPRIIAIEPACMQYAQQAIRDILYKKLESDYLTAGHVNFSDQSVNQVLAMSSSIDSRFATIDLKDASDRVPLDLALLMFDSNPDLRDAIEACRSRRAELPDGRIVHLSKFASMGNALCFPVESMYFYTICVMALLRFHNLPVSRRNIERVTSDVFVYGDDLIIPADAATVVFDYLQKYNCKVNDRKTFYRGKFRESCGVDAFCGTDVTPVYITNDLPKNLRNSSELISCVENGNRFHQNGYYHTSQFLFERAEKILGPLPHISESSGILGKRFWGPTSKVTMRYNRRYHDAEIRAWVPSSVELKDPIDGFAALHKALEKLERLKDLSLPRAKKPMEYSVLHGAATLKRRWVARYNLA